MLGPPGILLTVGLPGAMLGCRQPWAHIRSEAARLMTAETSNDPAPARPCPSCVELQVVRPVRPSGVRAPLRRYRPTQTTPLGEIGGAVGRVISMPVLEQEPIEFLEATLRKRWLDQIYYREGGRRGNPGLRCLRSYVHGCHNWLVKADVCARIPSHLGEPGVFGSRAIVARPSAR